MNPTALSAIYAICWECISLFALFKGDLITPQQSPLPNGLIKTNMSKSYDGTLLDHLAEYMI
jgi:hypothetical protein